MRLDEIQEAFEMLLGRAELTQLSLSNIVKATENVLLRQRVTILSFDRERGAARLSDGRVLILPYVPHDAAPPLGQLDDVLAEGSELDIDIIQLPDGSLLGQNANPTEPVSDLPITQLDPRCLALRFVPANPALPDYDHGIRHHPRGYEWNISQNSSETRHYLEFGAALAAVKVMCNTEQPGAYHHWLWIGTDHNNNGQFNVLATSLTSTSQVVVLKPVSHLPAGVPIPMLVREYRAPVLSNGVLGMAELVIEDNYVIQLRPYGYYGNASYSRTKFELPDAPSYSGFQSANVTTVYRSFPLSMQPLNDQIFMASSYKVTGNSSSFPNVQTIFLNTSFAAHLKDPNEDLFFAHTNDLRRGLYAPKLKGFNHARPFEYRVTLPKIVRDRLHDCATDSYYRIPFIGPLGFGFFGTWSVSQGNNGGFTHKGWDKYAFDFPKSAGYGVFAARGGIVEDVRTTGCFSCWDPNAPDGMGGTGACTTGGCSGQYAPNFVKIRHQDGTIARYLHFKKGGVKVSKGQKIYRGDYIGDVGTTGCSTGNHLHFDVLTEDQSESIPVRFEAYDSDFDYHDCYLPPSNSNGWSTNEPWWWPF
jgi:murein DD-endopeptidase MepM/ murein hydrolase activator NlpD